MKIPRIEVIRDLPGMIIVVAGLILMATCSDANKDSSKFLSQAMQDGVAEIQVCQLALKQSQNPDVRSFAQRMIQDHTNADNEISQLATKKGINLETSPSAKQKLTYDALAQLSGAAFDKEFMSHNVSDHTEDIKDFQEQSQSGTDADVKSLAAKTLSMLQTHLQLSNQVKDKVKGSS